MEASQKLSKIRENYTKELGTVKTLLDLENLHTKYLGRKSELNGVLRTLKDLKPEERAVAGKEANKLQKEIETELERREQRLKVEEMGEQLKKDTLDPTLPGIPTSAANLHPLTKERIKIEEIFQQMGFKVVEPFMVDDDYHNFTALNIPEGHPARDNWDTFNLETKGLALIPHTSAMQNRIIRENEPPIRAIVPGKCFRREATDAHHEHSFFQVEGVYVDRGIKMSDMLGTLNTFLNNYLGREIPIKLQPTYFPFVEPGMEVMMDWSVMSVNAGTKAKPNWLEVIPCGPIHPFVLREAGVDPDVYSGFAWGYGLERLIMVKYEIDDLRYFHSGKLDFINQF